MLSSYYALDLSGLQKIGQLFTALFQAFWPVFVIIFVASILLALLGIGARFGLGGIFKSIDNGPNRLMKRKTKASFAIFIAVAMMLLLMTSGSTPMVQAADGTAGTLEIGVTNILGSTPVTIRMYGLTSAADFKINWTGDNTGHSFTTGASQTEHFITVNIDKPSGSHDVTVYLLAQSTGNNTNSLDALTLYVSDSSIFPDDIILDIGIVLAIVFIMVAVVTTIKRKG